MIKYIAVSDSITYPNKVYKLIGMYDILSAVQAVEFKRASRAWPVILALNNYVWSLLDD